MKFPLKILVLACVLFIVSAGTVMGAEEQPPLFPFSKTEFEKAIKAAATEMHSPPWKFVQAKEYQMDTDNIYRVSDSLSANVLQSKQRKGIVDILVTMHNASKASTKETGAFFLSFAAVLSVVSPEMTAAERGELLRELGLTGNTGAFKEVTASKRNVRCTLSPATDTDRLSLQIAPAQ